MRSSGFSRRGVEEGEAISQGGSSGRMGNLSHLELSPYLSRRLVDFFQSAVLMLTEQRLVTPSIKVTRKIWLPGTTLATTHVCSSKV
jgi:hypothetical protein